MKILLINSSDTAGGASIACRRLGIALRKSGEEVTFLTKEKKTDLDWIQQADTGIWRGESTHYLEKLFFLPFEGSSQIRFHFSTASFGINIARLQAVQEADILHFHWINKGFLSFKGLQQLKALNKPIIWTCHDMWPFTGGCHYSGVCRRYEQHCGLCPYIKGDGESDLSLRIMEKKERLYQNMNLNIVTCSHWLGNAAKSASLFKKTPISVIPNPIDTDKFRPVTKPEYASDGYFNVLFQAMNIDDERKGFQYLLRALHILKERYPTLASKIRIHLFGKCQPETLKQIPFPVNYAGMLFAESDIIKAYQQADLFVIPSLEENLPNTIMESLSCGVPVVAFDSGGIPDMIRPDYNGVLCPVRNAESLADGIFHILNSPDLKNSMAVNARQWALDHYHETVVAKKYMEVYRESLTLRHEI